MKKFVLRRFRVHAEIAEVEADSFESAKEMLNSDATDFYSSAGDEHFDGSIEYIGEATNLTKE